MASYNLMKSEDRARMKAARLAEVAAIDAGRWPRDINDEMRWGGNRTFHDQAEKAAWARRMCNADLDYLDCLSARIADGELPGWED